MVEFGLGRVVAGQRGRGGGAELGMSTYFPLERVKFPPPHFHIFTLNDLQLSSGNSRNFPFPLSDLTFSHLFGARSVERGAQNSILLWLSLGVETLSYSDQQMDG